MRILYVMLLVILLGAYWFVLNRVRKSSRSLTPILGWMVGLAVFIIAPLTLLTINGGYKLPAIDDVSAPWGEVNLSRPEFLGPYIFIWLSLMLTCAVAFACAGRPCRGAGGFAFSRLKLERVVLLSMALSVVDWAAQIWINGGIAQFLLSHWYVRDVELTERFGAVFTLYLHLSLANQVLFTGAAVLHTNLGMRIRNMRWKFTILIVFFFLLELVMSGNRIFVLFYLLSFLCSCWLYRRNRIIAVLVVAAPVLMWVFTLWGAVRHDLTTISDSATSFVADSDGGNQPLSSAMSATEGAAVMLLMHMINDFGSRFDYLYGSTYARLFTAFVPRRLNLSRPPDFTTLAANLYLPGETTSMSSTALGEACANFGILGIFVLPIFTRLVFLYTDVLASGGERHDLVSAVSFVMLIWFARSTFAENAMTLIGVALVIWILKLESGLSIRRDDVSGPMLADTSSASQLALSHSPREATS